MNLSAPIATYEDTALVAWPTELARDSRGRLIVTQSGPNALPLVFDRSGVAARSLGRFGDGPGEFRQASNVTVGAGDSVYIGDRGAGRLTLYSPDARFVRAAPFPLSVFSMLWLTQQRLLLTNAAIADAPRIGLKFHLFDAWGNEVRSFGNPAIAITPANQYLLSHRLAQSRNGGFVAVPTFRPYSIQFWNRDLRLTRTLTRRTAWFSEETILLGPKQGKPVPAEVKAIWEEPNGHIRILFWVPSSRWREALQEHQAGDGEIDYTVRALGRLFDSVIEVIDPVTACLIAAARFDAPLFGPLNNGTSFSIASNADGRFQIQERKVIVTNTNF